MECWLVVWFFFFNDTATTEIYTLSLHDALPISSGISPARQRACVNPLRRDRIDTRTAKARRTVASRARMSQRTSRSEEHTSELQSRQYLVCRLLLEKKTIQHQTLYTA